MPLDGIWRFRFDHERRLQRPVDVDQWPLEIVVPFPPESRASGIGDTGFHPACWYERDFDLVPEGRRVLLHFGAVDYAARVWANDCEVASHEGGHTPFVCDITLALREDGHQTVTVLAEDAPHDLNKPRGKQDWQLEPHSIWYPRTTGIWQNVWLEQVSHTYIERLRWTPHLEKFAIGLEAMVTGERATDLSVEVELRHGLRILARDRYLAIDGEADRWIVLSDPGIDDYRNELLPGLRPGSGRCRAGPDRTRGRDRLRRCTGGADGSHGVQPGTTRHLDPRLAKVPEPERSRAHYVIGENASVLAAVEALRAGDSPALGALLNASHVSLRVDFEVSCAELDTLVELAQSQQYTYGACMTGGGFGGSILALAAYGTAEAVATAESTAYRQRTGRSGGWFVLPAAV